MIKLESVRRWSEAAKFCSAFDDRLKTVQRAHYARGDSECIEGSKGITTWKQNWFLAKLQFLSRSFVFCVTCTGFSSISPQKCFRTKSKNRLWKHDFCQKFDSASFQGKNLNASWHLHFEGLQEPENVKGQLEKVCVPFLKQEVGTEKKTVL